MSRAELMAKMAPRGVVITGSGFGGKVEISATDVAGALGMGGLSYPAYLLGLMKYAGDRFALGRLHRVVRGLVEAIAQAEGRVIDELQAEGVAVVVVYENLHDTVCRACNGSGSLAAKPCEPCAGVGRVPLSNRARARVAGVAETTWRRDLRWLADRAYQVVHGWDVEVQAHLARQFGRAAGLTEAERAALRVAANEPEKTC